MKKISRREQVQTKKAELLRLAPTEDVKKKIIALDRSYSFLVDEIAFAEVCVPVHVLRVLRCVTVRE